MHEELPLPLNVPLGHAAQEVDAAVELKLPAGHAAQEVDAAVEL